MPPVAQHMCLHQGPRIDPAAFAAAELADSKGWVKLKDEEGRCAIHVRKRCAIPLTPSSKSQLASYVVTGQRKVWSCACEEGGGGAHSHSGQLKD